MFDAANSATKSIIAGLDTELLSAVCCFDAAVYSQLSAEDVALEPVYSSLVSLD